jgi:hypothetical protein
MEECERPYRLVSKSDDLYLLKHLWRTKKQSPGTAPAMARGELNQGKVGVTGCIRRNLRFARNWLPRFVTDCGIVLLLFQCSALHDCRWGF